MSLSRSVARPLLAAMFIAGGVDAARNPSSKVKAADLVVSRLPYHLDTESAVRANGLTQVVAGTTLALGIAPRLSAAALAGSLIPTTVAGHRFWEETDDLARANQRVHFLKNLAMLGGLLLATVDTAGRPSVSWRARRARHRAHQAARLLPGGHDLTTMRRASPMGSDRGVTAVFGHLGRQRGPVDVRQEHVGLRPGVR